MDSEVLQLGVDSFASMPGTALRQTIFFLTGFSVAAVAGELALFTKLSNETDCSFLQVEGIPRPAAKLPPCFVCCIIDGCTRATCVHDESFARNFSCLLLLLLLLLPFLNPCSAMLTTGGHG